MPLTTTIAIRAILGLLLAILTTTPVPLAAQAAAPALASVPSDRLGEGWWADRHKAILAAIAAHADPDVILIGDSITNNYDKAEPPDENFRPTWQTFYAPRRAMNLGFSGDTTSNVLWRLAHGEVDSIHPRVAIVLIGTNDTGIGGRSATETERGIDAVVADLEHRLPETRILLLGLLPSGISAEKSTKDAAINRYLAAVCGEHPRVTYLDIGAVLLKPDGVIDTGLFYDPRLPQHAAPLHPNSQAQRMMAEAIEPTLVRLLGEPPRVPLSGMTDVNSALIAVPALEQDSYDWVARHHAVLADRLSIAPKVVMIGDSITHFWGGPPAAARVNGAASWQRLFGATPVLNLGFGWDRVQNVLWRIRAGELEGLAPKWVILNIGTNNLVATDHARANTPAEIDAGIAAIVREVRERLPASRVVVMGIFPRGSRADDPLRAPIAATNRLLAKRFRADGQVRFLDIGPRFLAPDGTLPTAMMPDGTHPSEAGYQIWADALAAIGVR